ncbi:MAG: CvpA family protein [Candidatus Eremiobacteraeota bacterium]|nr:CvpA family protein [Candidatus Eremiobacteraeota bacterium]
MINLIGLLLIALFAFSGYKRGLIRMLASLMALAIAGLVCQPFGGIGAIFLPSSVPKVFAPLGGTLVAGIFFFVVLDLLIGIPLKKQAKAREEAGEPKVLPWEAYTGLVFGLFWGLGISVLIFSGIAAIGRAQRAVRRSEAMVSYREKHPGPWGTIMEKDLRQVLEVGPPPEQGEAWAEMVESSVFAPVVDKVNPLDAKVEKTLTDLSVVCNDPQLFTLFQAHPTVQAFMANPVFIGLAQDPQIAEAVRAGNYKAVMDHPKISQVAQDPLLRQQLKELKIDKLLADIREQSYKLPRNATRRRYR